MLCVSHYAERSVFLTASIIELGKRGVTVPVTVHAFSDLVTISLIKGVNSNNFSYKLIKGTNLAHKSL